MERLLLIARVVERRVHYAWVVMAVTFIAVVAASGIRSVPGVLIIPLEKEFGWDRAAISFAVSLNLLLFGLCGPFAASIVERVGMRKVMIGALFVIGIAVALTTQMSATWQLYLLWGVLVGLAAGSLTGWISATVANRWFVAHRGVVVGVLTAAGATGQLIFLPVLASTVEAVGWRTAVLIVAAVALVAIPLVFAFIRSHPKDVGVQPYGATPESIEAARRVDEARAATPPGNPFAEAIRTLVVCSKNRDFLLLCASFFICGASTNGLVGTHLIPASMEHGIPEVTAASMLALMGVFDVAGTTFSGWLSDRYDSRLLLVWYYSFRGIALLFLPYAFGTGFFGLALFVVFYGLDWVATVPPTVRIAADIFGKQKVGTVYAWIMVAHQFGAAAIAFAAGEMHNIFGNYQAAFMTSGVLCLIAAGLVIRIGKTSPADAQPSPRPTPALTANY